ncbi:MAG TPA: hypothetical protein VM597_23340 [Gemmataceae bacterium]|jgi:hypothetical protein|nr:hypothetical protein [Gemmataceae bacterium]
MSRAVLVGFCLVASAASGCMAPRTVMQTQDSVVVAIPDNTNTWPGYYQDEAAAEARKYFPDAMLVNTTRVKVGEQMTNTQDVTRRDIGGGNNQPKVGEVTTASNTTTVSDQYEYHLEFRPRTIRHTGPGMSTLAPGGGAAATNPPAPTGAPLAPLGDTRGQDPRTSRPDQNPRPGFNAGVEGMYMRGN